MKAMLASLALIGLGAFGLVLAAQQAPKRSPGVASVTYELEVDVARARAVGWVAADASDAEAVEGALRVVKRRLDAMERQVELHGDPEHAKLELRMPQLQSRERELFAEMFESLGLCEFLFVADDDKNVAGLDLHLDQELAKLERWRKANPSTPLGVFNALDPAAGPHRRLLWLESRFVDTLGPPMPLLLPDRPEDHLGAASIARAYPAGDSYGYPAVGIELTDGRADDFERFTGTHTWQRMAIVLEGQVRSAPTLCSALLKTAIIEGRFKDEDVKHLVTELRKRHGPLRVLDIR